ncbi:hypothetical protein V5O48_016798 [Marasmius crinis-equi]|uniref:Uncharacterized protein n=1 Tax=Marasmius crinis-equi TaxID=585013 RepID=A0ABR3EQR0_9AGAR
MFFAKRPTSSPSSTSRPKGLWKAKSRVIEEKQKPKPPSRSLKLSPLPPASSSSAASTSSCTLQSTSEEEDELPFDDLASTSSSSSSSSKRRRVEEFCSYDSGSEDDVDQDQVYLWDYSSYRSPSPFEMKKRQFSISVASPSPKMAFASPPLRSRPRKRVQSSISLPGEVQDGDERVTWADWGDLQEMLASVEGSDQTSSQLPNLRAIIHECHRILSLHPDPSSFFLHYAHPTPSTAVHTLLGHALFLFGDIISRHPNASVTLDFEPAASTAYWLAALDVFVMGDSLPQSPVEDGHDQEPSDWKMGLVWGRTLVSLVRTLQNSQPDRPNQAQTPHSDSPLGFIQLNRPPHTPSATETEITDLLKVAMDQVSGGFFHMPRPAPFTSTSTISSTSTSTSSCSSSASNCLSAIASDVLDIAPRLSVASDRVYWLRWAESLFGSASASASALVSTASSSSSTQVALPPAAAVARGRCNLLLARALFDVGEEEEDWKEEAQETLDAALEFFEQAFSSDTPSPRCGKRKFDEIEDDEATGREEVEQMLKEARELLVKLG